MDDRKLILAPGERLLEDCGPDEFVELVEDESIQTQRRIGAAVVLREMAE